MFILIISRRKKKSVLGSNDILFSVSSPVITDFCFQIFCHSNSGFIFFFYESFCFVFKKLSLSLLFSERFCSSPFLPPFVPYNGCCNRSKSWKRIEPKDNFPLKYWCLTAYCHFPSENWCFAVTVFIGLAHSISELSPNSFLLYFRQQVFHTITSIWILFRNQNQCIYQFFIDFLPKDEMPSTQKPIFPTSSPQPDLSLLIS